MASIFTSLVLPIHDNSLYMKALSWTTLAVISLLGFSEITGDHFLGYSKFVNVGSRKRVSVSTKTGMLLCYMPALLAGAASVIILLPRHDRNDARFVLLSFALTLHYLKRVLEVLFIHKYSGKMDIVSAIIVSLSYFSSTANLVYFHYNLYPIKGSNHENQPPIIDMKYIGVVLFLLGISGNLYHHIILSQLRGKKDHQKEKTYKIPKGGLFGLVICPHYLFEIIEFVGISFISQTLFGYFFTIGTIFYLSGRSYATRKWYVSKFEDFPRDVKALIPFVF